MSYTKTILASTILSAGCTAVGIKIGKDTQKVIDELRHSGLYSDEYIEERKRSLQKCDNIEIISIAITSASILSMMLPDLFEVHLFLQEK